MSAVVVALVAASVVLLVALAGLTALRANRLDRLHVRTDAASAALLAALDRRAVVARAVAAVGGLPDPQRGDLRAAAAAAEAVPPDARELREARENALAAHLARVDRAPLPPYLLAELNDAEQRVVLARRVHNDAVRDTRALRRTRLVRWLRLAGTAPTPRYFEIAEPEPRLGEAAATDRAAARVLLLEPGGRVLLFACADPALPQETYWFTPGGGVEAGEDEWTAAVREVHEETGIRVVAGDLVGPLWRRDFVFTVGGAACCGREAFFLARVEDTRVDTAGMSGQEARGMLGYRWWSAAELAGTAETVYPRQLGELLPAVVDGGWDGVSRSVW